MRDPNTCLSDHWIQKLKEYDGHVLTRVLQDFSGELFSFLCSSYIYLGTVENKAKIKRKIAIIHYHSSLMGPLKFMDIQSFEAYKNIPNLTKMQIAELSVDITRDSVTLLAFPNALEKTQLNFIEECRTLILCDETGRVDQYDI